MFFGIKFTDLVFILIVSHILVATDDLQTFLHVDRTIAIREELRRKHKQIHSLLISIPRSELLQDVKTNLMLDIPDATFIISTFFIFSILSCLSHDQSNASLGLPGSPISNGSSNLKQFENHWTLCAAGAGGGVM